MVRSGPAKRSEDAGHQPPAGLLHIVAVIGFSASIGGPPGISSNATGVAVIASSQSPSRSASGANGFSESIIRQVNRANSAATAACSTWSRRAGASQLGGDEGAAAKVELLMGGRDRKQG
jgi:hypothetical protein